MTKRHEEHEKRKDGGGAMPEKKKMQVYNAKDSKAEEAGMDETADFKKGGRTKKKTGGHVEGKKAEERMDRPKREHHAKGGEVGRPKRAAGGRSPYSSGHDTKGSTDSTAGRGHEGVGLSGED